MKNANDLKKKQKLCISIREKPAVLKSLNCLLFSV